MIDIPAMLLHTPVFGKGFPFSNPVVDGYGSDERKQDREGLDTEGDCCETPSRLIQVLKRQ
jgi:hypothetical protein